MGENRPFYVIIPAPTILAKDMLIHTVILALFDIPDTYPVYHDGRAKAEMMGLEFGH